MSALKEQIFSEKSINKLYSKKLKKNLKGIKSTEKEWKQTCDYLRIFR